MVVGWRLKDNLSELLITNVDEECNSSTYNPQEKSLNLEKKHV